jgi:putative flippase GtrA
MMERTFIKFILVGIMNTLFGYSIFALFISLKVHYTLAVLLATILGIVFNFKTIGKLVFRNSSNHLIFRFVGVYGAIYFLNVAALGVFDRFRVNMYVAGMLLLAPMAIISFILQRKYVFTEKVRRCH